MTTFEIVVTFDGFLVLKPHALQGDMYFNIRNGHISVSSFVTSTISDPMKGRAGV